MLVDMLLARWVPSYRSRPKRRVIQAPKFYLADGTEVDFVVGDMRLAVEAKASPNIRSRHLRGLCSVIRDHPSIQRRVVVSRPPRARRTSDGIDVLHVEDFVRQLWDDRLT